MPYIIFEGPDGVGKSTVINKIATSLINKYNVYKTQLPGYTPLGKHLRKLVKTPQQVNPEITDIDPHTRQLLYAADYSAYAHWLNTIITRPNICILADRCSAISSLIYGEADGANVESLKQVYQGINAPLADLLIIYNAHPNITSTRMAQRQETPDHFDQKGIDFKLKIHTLYSSLTHEQTAHIAKRLVHIDASQTEDQVYQQTKYAINYEYVIH